MINTIEDIKKFINDTGFKKIFILCGKKSFITSGAEIFFKKLLNNKETRLFYKNSELPILEELIKIIHDIKSFKPDLILAVGGGAVIDYAKIANVIDIKDDLANLIVNYSYPFKRKYTKLAVIPTTAGSGAEVTSNAVIYVDVIKNSF
jgi:alcohol dehydrogenase class IV